MERRYLNLGEQAFLLINGPLVLLNLTANVFYAQAAFKDAPRISCLVLNCFSRPFVFHVWRVNGTENLGGVRCVVDDCAVQCA